MPVVAEDNYSIIEEDTPLMFLHFYRSSLPVHCICSMPYYYLCKSTAQSFWDEGICKGHLSAV